MQYLVYVVYFSTLANGNVTCRSALSCLEVNHVQFDAFRLALLQLAIRKSYNITILTYNFLYITFPSRTSRWWRARIDHMATSWLDACSAMTPIYTPPLHIFSC